LNDDEVAPGMGFGTHPHDNMEIITIPLEGIIAHKDSMGNNGTISVGEIQVMSAGTGVRHSEFNFSSSDKLRLLQIWVFPDKENVTPRYDQQKYPELKENELIQILSPHAEDDGVWIHQDAWFHLASFDEGKSDIYSLKKEGNGIYLFNLEGRIKANGQTLERRDGFGIWDSPQMEISAESKAEFLIMEVPMKD
jgi:redox-sensitive bicupin YhaK (pirin superfamily)